ncbi:twin-arginine translocase TatA/TatE family subunit [Tissierella sp. Yu-01]|uniref:twin-arginine translocase TatA/TatE family subunit n=1 Tax=Tissierella sp. Yu-01 TaxID=3035694 RepID=UPI00240CFB8F|nr:twin-arginine translocase TatA/TatE family subunit [Tissierella sp. Yu-01]WFA07865.1 twin-arginine translocase TatA/TatE family subunit [Tissierella sp. Yu-01]
MSRLGPMELVLILAIALVVFGPSKLPGVGKALGKAINEFKTSANSDNKDDDVVEVKDDSDDKEQA